MKKLGQRQEKKEKESYKHISNRKILPWSLDVGARAELLSSSFTSAFSCSLSLANISKCSCRGRQRVIQNNDGKTVHVRFRVSER